MQQATEEEYAKALAVSDQAWEAAKRFEPSLSALQSEDQDNTVRFLSHLVAGELAHRRALADKVELQSADPVAQHPRNDLRYSRGYHAGVLAERQRNQGADDER